MIHGLLESVSDAAQAELMDRASRRGFLLRSELEAMHDPAINGNGATEQLVEEFHDLGITLIDDLADTEGDRVDPHPLIGPVADPLTAYLARAATYELLEADEEADLAKRNQAGDAARHLLYLDGHLDDVRIQQLEAIARDGERAFDRIINANLRLVVPTAKKFAGDDLPLIEAVQEGNLGLIRAAQKFDPAKGYRFSTYAVWWIRQAIQRGLASRSRTIRAPARVWEQAAKTRRAAADLQIRLGREPRDDEVAEASGVPLEQVIEVRSALRPITSLDLPVGEDQDATLGSLMPDPAAPDPQVSSEVADLRARVVEALRPLPERERVILELRYGLRDGEPRPLAEIGKIVHLSRDRVGQLERAALAELRSSDASGLRELEELLIA